MGKGAACEVLPSTASEKSIVTGLLLLYPLKSRGYFSCGEPQWARRGQHEPLGWSWSWVGLDRLGCSALVACRKHHFRNAGLEPPLCGRPQGECVALGEPQLVFPSQAEHRRWFVRPEADWLGPGTNPHRNQGQSPITLLGRAYCLQRCKRLSERPLAGELRLD